MPPTSAMPFNPYSVGVCAIPTSCAGADGTVVSQQLQSVIPNPITTLASQQKLQRADRLEVYTHQNQLFNLSVKYLIL
jgi:hypothetical protein